MKEGGKDQRMTPHGQLQLKLEMPGDGEWGTYMVPKEWAHPGLLRLYNFVLGCVYACMYT